MMRRCLDAAAPPAPTFVERGFTLTEMAVVLVIVALLIGGMILPMAAQQDLRSSVETEKLLVDVSEALYGFAMTHGRLPCPADPTIPTGGANAGLEATTGTGSALTCSNANGVGVLPWATLGLKEVDAWGNRFTYRVVVEFARGATGQTSFTGIGCPPPVNPASSAFALCSQGNLTINGGAVANNVPAVVISHGKNGSGAFRPDGTQLATGSDVDERDNQLIAGGTDMVNVNFVSKTPTQTFDDLVVWVSPNILFNRMIAAGRLP